MSTEQAKPDILLQEQNIEKAMENLCDGASCHQVARLLNQASYTGRLYPSTLASSNKIDIYVFSLIQQRVIVL
ncbi:hypothetical protein ACFLV5_04760 [Chloroflexota bacterium]